MMRSSVAALLALLCLLVAVEAAPSGNSSNAPVATPRPKKTPKATPPADPVAASPASNASASGRSNATAAQTSNVSSPQPVSDSNASQAAAVDQVSKGEAEGTAIKNETANATATDQQPAAEQPPVTGTNETDAVAAKPQQVEVNATNNTDVADNDIVDDQAPNSTKNTTTARNVTPAAVGPSRKTPNGTAINNTATNSTASNATDTIESVADEQTAADNATGTAEVEHANASSANMSAAKSPANKSAVVEPATTTPKPATRARQTDNKAVVTRDCKLSLGLDIAWVKSNRQSFEKGFATDIGNALGVDSSKVRVLSVEAGSVIVRFGVTTRTAAKLLGDLPRISAEGGLSFKTVGKAAGKPVMAGKIEVGKLQEAANAAAAAAIAVAEKATPQPPPPPKILKRGATLSIPRRLWKKAHAMVTDAPKSYMKLKFMDDISNDTEALTNSIAASLGVNPSGVKLFAIGLDGHPTDDFSPPVSTAMTLEADYDAIAANMSKFKSSFKTDMATSLGVVESKINLYNVSAGSVIVDFGVKGEDADDITVALKKTPPKLSTVSLNAGMNISLAEVSRKVHPIQIMVEVKASDETVEPVVINASVMNEQLTKSMNVTVLSEPVEVSSIAGFVAEAHAPKLNITEEPEPLNVTRMFNKTLKLRKNMTRLFKNFLNVSNGSNGTNATSLCDECPTCRECVKPEVPYENIWVKKQCPMNCTGLRKDGGDYCVPEWVDSRDLGWCNPKFNATRFCTCNGTGNYNETYMWRGCRDVSVFHGKPDLEFNGTCNCTWPWREWYKADWTNATGCRPPTCAEKHQDCGNCTADPDCGWCENQTQWNEFDYKLGTIVLKKKTVGVCLEGKADVPGLHPVSNWNMSKTCKNKPGFRFYPGDRETGPIKKIWRFAPFECTDMNCKEHLNCSTCLADVRCGWCSDVPKGKWELDLPKEIQKKKEGVKRGGCYEAQWTRDETGKDVQNGRLGPRDMRCPKGDWNYETCVPPKCDVHGSCHRCLKDIRCGWCMTSCIHASLDGLDDRAQVCPKSDYLWNEKCPVYAPPPHLRLFRGQKKPVQESAGCEDIADADKCVKNDKCGWCGMENRCSRGDSEGRFSHDCNSWYYGITPEDACTGYKSCSKCTKDRMCGWCGSDKICQAKATDKSVSCQGSWHERTLFTDGDVCGTPIGAGANSTAAAKASLASGHPKTRVVMKGRR